MHFQYLVESDITKINGRKDNKIESQNLFLFQTFTYFEWLWGFYFHIFWIWNACKRLQSTWRNVRKKYIYFVTFYSYIDIYHMHRIYILLVLYGRQTFTMKYLIKYVHRHYNIHICKIIKKIITCLEREMFFSHHLDITSLISARHIEYFSWYSRASIRYSPLSLYSHYLIFLQMGET